MATESLFRETIRDRLNTAKADQGGRTPFKVLCLLGSEVKVVEVTEYDEEEDLISVQTAAAIPEGDQIKSGSVELRMHIDNFILVETV